MKQFSMHRYAHQLQKAAFAACLHELVPRAAQLVPRAAQVAPTEPAPLSPAVLEWPERELLVTDELGAAFTRIPPGYEGPAKVLLSHKTTRVEGFPNEVEANRAARLAVGALGGYSKAVVVPADPSEVTFPSAEDWFFN